MAAELLLCWAQRGGELLLQDAALDLAHIGEVPGHDVTKKHWGKGAATCLRSETHAGSSGTLDGSCRRLIIVTRRECNGQLR